MRIDFFSLNFSDVSSVVLCLLLHVLLTDCIIAPSHVYYDKFEQIKMMLKKMMMMMTMTMTMMMIFYFRIRPTF